MPRRKRVCRNDSIGRYLARITPESSEEARRETAATQPEGDLADRLRRIIESRKDEQR